MKINEKFNGSEISISFKDDNLIISLDSHPSTGYSWYEKNRNQEYFKLESSKCVNVSHLGAETRQEFNFTPRKRGTDEITLQYKRIWENKEPLEIFTIKVNII